MIRSLDTRFSDEVEKAMDKNPSFTLEQAKEFILRNPEEGIHADEYEAYFERLQQLYGRFAGTKYEQIQWVFANSQNEELSAASRRALQASRAALLEKAATAGAKPASISSEEAKAGAKGEAEHKSTGRGAEETKGGEDAGTTSGQGPAARARPVATTSPTAPNHSRQSARFLRPTRLPPRARSERYHSQKGPPRR